MGELAVAALPAHAMQEIPARQAEQRPSAQTHTCSQAHSPCWRPASTLPDISASAPTQLIWGGLCHQRRLAAAAHRLFNSCLGGTRAHPRFPWGVAPPPSREEEAALWDSA